MDRQALQLANRIERDATRTEWNEEIAWYHVRQLFSGDDEYLQCVVDRAELIWSKWYPIQF